ncbi:MAG: Diguanylate cyclase/phosphodiesterase domain 1 [Myxococcaceae bacterium]|nr:Diguanylate cyclase/phosphodiesterase domain 1 [Myxococcaceae bacterium]
MKSKSACAHVFLEAALRSVTGPTQNRVGVRQPQQPASGDAVEARLREHRRSLAQLMRSNALTSGEVALALSELTELASELLGSARASVWQLSVDGSELACVDAFDNSSGLHSQGARLHAAQYPDYFAALDDERAMVVEDTRSDPRTRELSDGYLVPHGIGAMLDAPVFLRGRMVGVVCIEHVDEPRHWAFWEELVAGTLADFVALVLTAREQLRVEGQLKELRTRVDEMLESRTSQVVRENADLQREVDALQLAADAIRKSEDDLRLLFAASPVPMLLIRRSDGRVLLANEVSATALRATVEELQGQPVGELFACRSDLSNLFETLAESGVDEPREVQLRTLQGDTFWALLSGRSVLFSTMEAVMLGFSDLTSQKAVEHQLRVLAQRDPLTQAYNRHHFWQLAHVEMARVKRYRRPLSMAMIDADHFKNVNDQYGHDVGDLVLRSIVDNCHDSLRKNDVLARYGGEEFIVLLPETAVDGALAVVERLRERIAQSPLALDDGRLVPMTVSIGLAGLSDYEEGFEALLKRADDALYVAKRSGRNCVQMG